MPFVCRVGDTSTHGGTVQTGSPDVRANGLAVARINDTFLCPIHGATPIVSTPVTNDRANGRLIAAIGAQTQCGAVLTTGSPNVTAI